MTEWLIKNTITEATEIEIRGKKIPKIIVQILKNRGYDTPQKIEEFFAPSLTNLPDPFLISDMAKAVERIIAAIKNNERILVHGDYDADGITGVALLVRNLKKLNLEVEYYIPHRLIEGYGVSKSGIDHAVNCRCSLMITVDCGITANEEIDYAKTKGLDVIVCDHHKPPDVLPEALALLNPRLSSSIYPFKELAGVGVAFKFLQAIYEKLNLPHEELYEDLDLVALGSVVDVVPLIGENRCLVKYGIKKIVTSNKPGFKALLQETGLKRELLSYHLGFVIGPRINACGRLDEAKEALELLLTGNESSALQIAHQLSLDNQKRQAIEDTILYETKEVIEKERLDKTRVIVVGKEEWHEGVVGIVASRIADEYAKPAILLSLKEETAKGSGRSVPGFDIAEALTYCRDLLIKYGGHKQAAGLELKKENLFAFREYINQYADNFDEKIFIKKHYYELKLDLTDITQDVVFFLKYFEPTGAENPQPVFYGEDFEVVGIPRVVGENHLRFAVRKDGVVYQAIAFGKAENILSIEPGSTRVNCLYTVAEDSFIGKRKVLLKIKEMKKCGN